MFLLGFIVLGMFLFIQPIKAETETVGIHPTDDNVITCWWDKDDGFFIEGGLSYSPDSEELKLGYDAGTGNVLERQPYLKFDIPIVANKTITSMRLRIYRLRCIEHSDGIDQCIFINMVNNNWNETDIQWDNKPEDMEDITTIEYIVGTTNEYSYLYFGLDSFIEHIENNTISIRMSLERVVDNGFWETCYMTFVSQDNVDRISQRPTLIIEYEDIRPPLSFMLTSNAGSPDKDGRFILDWTESEFATSYSVYQNDTLTESGLKTNIYSMDVSTNGTYSYKIVAFNEFGNSSSNEIIVSVDIQSVPPSSFILTSNADNPDIDGDFSLQWTDSDYANHYSIYQNNSLIESGLKNRNYYMENYSSGIYVFKVISFNYYGNASSNEITVNIEIPPEPKPYPNADYFYADLDQYYATFVAYNADEYDFFNASVWSDNIITGYIMDKSNYNQWVNEGMFQPSSNIVYVNFGIANRWHTFIPTHADTWYIVFVNAFAEHTHLDAYIYFHEDYFTEPDPDPTPTPPQNIIPSFNPLIIIGTIGCISVIWTIVIKKKINYSKCLKH